MGTTVTEGRRRNGLSAKFVAAVSMPGKYHDGGRLGLYLRVDAGGRRFWVQRIVVCGKRCELGLGSPPFVTLADARAAAFNNKQAASAGRNPLAEKRAAREAAKAASEAKRKSEMTFEAATRNAHNELSPTWKNPKDRAAFLTTLETYLFPAFGKKPVADVTSADVRQAILAARGKAPEVARKLTFRTAAVFRWAIAEGYRTDNPATADALALPKVEKALTHRKALPYARVSDCIAALRASGAYLSSKLAIEFLILTATRSGEVRGARWEEVDRAARVWTIPKERMKMGRPHRIPLCQRALEILDAADALADASGLIFPSVRSKPLSDGTLSKLVKELGFEADIHGFCTSFRTWAQERTNVPREICEAALAHTLGDAAERAYARSDVFEKRRKLMDSWAAFIAAQRAEVVSLAVGA